MMSQLISDASIMIHSLGWAILHSFWQGALGFTILRLLLLLFPNISPKHKYRLAYTALAGLFFWFGTTFLQEWNRLQAITVTITESDPGADTYKVFLIKTVPQQLAISDFADKTRLALEQYFPLLILIYMIGLVFFVSRLVINLYQVRSLRLKGVESPAEDMLQMLERLGAALGIEKKVKLLLTSYLNVPVVFGALRPVILLPLATIHQLNTDQLEAIIIHELAHIKRNDYLLNIFQTIIETILFFNPFTWLISATIRREREHCCDDLVLGYTSMPLPYAKALATLESYRLSSGSLAMAATGNSNQLFNRIKRIMEMKKDNINYSQLIIPFIIILAIAGSLVWLTPSFAQSKKEKDKEEQTAATGGSNGKITVIDDNGKKKIYHDMDDIPAATKKQIKEAMTASGVAIETADDAIRLAGDVLKQVDVASITNDVNKALAGIDWNEINDEVTKALKEVDHEKIGREVNAALKDVNWEQINDEVQKALNEAGVQLRDPKLREEIRRKIREAKEDAKEAKEDAKKDMEEARRDLLEARRDLQDEKRKAGKAKHGYSSNDDNMPVPSEPPIAPEPAEPAAMMPPVSPVAPAVPSTGNYDRMLKEMEADHLIDRSKGFDIRKRGNSLTINGAEQYQYIANKYNKYMKGDDVTIKGKMNGSKRSLSVNINN